MTLVLSFVSPTYVVQASDGRLTRFPDGQVVEHEANKAIFFCGQTAIAYTGLATIGRVPTDEWVLDQLSASRSLWEGLRHLRKELTRAFRGMNLTGIPLDVRGSLKRLALVVVGFTTFRELDHPRLTAVPPNDAFAAVISNFIDRDGTWLPSAERDFSLGIGRLGRGQFALHVAGARVPSRIEAPVRRCLRICVQRRAGAHAVARLLARAVRDVSDVDCTVGPNVMVTILERGRLNPGNPGIGSAPIPLREKSELSHFSRSRDDRLGPTYIYNPSAASVGMYHGPAVVCAGWCIKELKFGPRDLFEAGSSASS